MKPRRLCFIVESGTDVRLVDGLAERFELTVLARRIVGGVELNWPPAMPVEIVPGPASRLGFAGLVLRYLLGESGRYDFVMVQSYGLAALAANLASRVTGTRAVMLVCSPIESYYECRRLHAQSGKPFRSYELWLLKALAQINGVIGQQYFVLSDHLRQVIEVHGTRRPIEMLPIYGVDTELFSPPAEAKVAIKSRLKLPLTGSLIFFSSRVAPEKDSETLLAAVKMLVNEGRDLWLLHRSGGYQSFTRSAELFGIADRVIATDAVHPHLQLPQDYQACDLCVQASRAEGLGFSPLEALACETPVVATAVGGLKETIIDGQTGWTYPIGNANALASCIAAALDNPEEAAKRAAVGRRLVLERFDRRKVFDQFERIIERDKARLPARDLSEVPK